MQRRQLCCCQVVQIPFLCWEEVQVFKFESGLRQRLQTSKLHPQLRCALYIRPKPKRCSSPHLLLKDLDATPQVLHCMPTFFLQTFPTAKETLRNLLLQQPF